MICAGDNAVLPTTAGELKLLEEVVRSLPADAVRELFSLGVCPIYHYRFLYFSHGNLFFLG